MSGAIAAGPLGFIAGFLLKTTAVLALALVAAAASGRRRAALRHSILSFSLIGLLLLPALTLVPFRWRTSVLPGWLDAAGLGTASRDTADPRADAEPGPMALSSSRPGQPGTPGAASLSLTQAATGPGPLEPAGSSPPLPNPASSLAPRAPTGSSGAAHLSVRAGGSAADTLNAIAAVIWAAGLAALLLRMTVGLAGAVRLTAEGAPLGGPAWRGLLERFLAIVPLGRKVRLRSHPQVLVPLTWGWRKPVVLFPDGTESWSDEERSSALFHELAHVKRADFLVMVLVRTSLAVFWWNPLCWIAYRELLRTQELACDELVLRAGIRPSIYAASLLAFRRSAGFRWNPSAALLGLLGRSPFQERLAAILRQKMNFMEVKMKTKIMLAAVLVLAVALVGTARPAVGSGAPAAAVLAETALPAADAIDVAPPAANGREMQMEIAAVQEKEQEKAKAAEKAKEAEKAKAATEKTIVIKGKQGANAPIEIVITEGDQVKTLVLERPVTITKGKDGDFLVITPEGKEPLVLKGEPLRLEIKAGQLEVLKEGKLVKIAEGKPMAIEVVKEGGEEGKTIVFYGKPEGKIAEGKAVKIVKEGEPGKAWTVVESGKGDGIWVVKEAPEKTGMAWTIVEPGKAFSLSWARQEELLEKVRAIQKQVEEIKAKKLELSALEESLKKLEAELQAKEEKIKEIGLKLDKGPGEYTIVKRVGGDKSEAKADVWVMSKDEAGEGVKAKVILEVGDKEGVISLIFTGRDGESGKAAFERAVDALKKDLPEGYKLAEQEYDEESGTMTFKIDAPAGKKTDETLVRKLVDSVKAAIKAEK